MELQQKVFLFDADVDFEKTPVNILVNGKEDGIQFKHLFKELQLEYSKVTGYSLLQYYTVKGGDLVDKEGNVISFVIKDKKVPIEKVRDPLAVIDAPVEVNLQYIKDVASLLSLSEIEKTISGLSNSEKKIMQEDRDNEFTAKELAKKEKEAKEGKEAEDNKAKEEARLAEEAKKVEEAAKEHEQKVEEKQIPQGENILTQKEQKILHRKLQRMGFEEFKKGEYSFYYGEDIPDSEKPRLLYDHTGYFEILDGSVVHEKDGEVEYEFTDFDKEDKVLILKEGKISIEKL